MGFLDQSGTPTKAYRLLKGADTAKAAIAAAIRAAYAPLYEADENAHSLSSEKLKSLVAQVAGTDETMTARIVSTFSALVKLADFSANAPQEQSPDDEPDDQKTGESNDSSSRSDGRRRLRPEFHYNIQVHLPSNGTEEVYLNIFNALRRSFE